MAAGGLSEGHSPRHRCPAYCCPRRVTACLGSWTNSVVATSKPGGLGILLGLLARKVFTWIS